MLKNWVRALARRAGYDIVGFTALTHTGVRRRLLLQQHRIDTVLDVGANVGQYARELRGEFGYRGRIVSFEPVSAAYSALVDAAAADPLWKAVNCGLGSTPGFLEINVAAQSVSSFFLKPAATVTELVAATRTTSTQQVAVRTLDEVWGEHCEAGARAWLKLDTQGFELEVLGGARHSLPKVTIVQAELALSPSYQGAPKACEVINYLESFGFVPVGLEPGFADPATGRVFEVDALFLRQG